MGGRGETANGPPSGVYGEGPLPSGTDGWCLERTAFGLRRYDHRCRADETAATERGLLERRPAP